MNISRQYWVPVRMPSHNLTTDPGGQSNIAKITNELGMKIGRNMVKQVIDGMAANSSNKNMLLYRNLGQADSRNFKVFNEYASVPTTFCGAPWGDNNQEGAEKSWPWPLRYMLGRQFVDCRSARQYNPAIRWLFYLSCGYLD